MKNRQLILGAVGFVLGLAGRAALGLAKNSVIISGGMATFRTLRWVANGVMAAGIALAAGAVLKLAIARSRAKQAAQQQDALRRAARKASAPLSTESGRFNEAKMRELLQTLFAQAPAQVLAYQPRFQAQLDRMNEYQANLNRLLQDNDATELSEAEAFLDKVEQNMFGKMRQVYNRLMMYDETAPITDLQAALDEALAHNDRALDQAKRLNSTVTDYVNNQSAAQETLGSVEAFIKVLQEELV